MTIIDEPRPIKPEEPRIETHVAWLWDMTDVESTVDKTRLDVSALRHMGEEAFVHVNDRGCILRLRPDEARLLARTLVVAAGEAEKLDRVDLSVTGDEAPYSAQRPVVPPYRFRTDERNL